MEPDPKAVPTGIDHLLRRAAHDEEFRAALIQQRGASAEATDVVLTDTERQILASIPESSLVDMIQAFRDRPSRPPPVRPDRGETALAGGCAPDMPERHNAWWWRRSVRTRAFILLLPIAVIILAGVGLLALSGSGLLLRVAAGALVLVAVFALLARRGGA